MRVAVTPAPPSHPADRLLIEVVRQLPVLTGFCYTQFADTYQEANGLLYVDRTPKFPIEEIANATRGAFTDRQRQIELEWRERMRRFHEEHDLD